VNTISIREGLIIHQKDGGGHEHQKDGMGDPLSGKTEESDHHVPPQSEEHEKRQESVIQVVGMKHHSQAAGHGHSEKGQIEEEPSRLPVFESTQR
jgi:hypothetical protein